MKPTVLATLALATAVAAVALHFLRPAPKIGYAETPVLLSEFTEAIKARKQFEEAQKEWDKNLRLLNDSLMSGMNRMKAGYEKASPGERHKMNDNLEKWNTDLQRYSNAVKKMSEEKEKKLMEPVLNKMNSFMKLWGEQHGYDLIFGTMNGGNILQANNGFNVTSKLLVDLNAHYRDLPAAGKKDSTKSPAKDTVSKGSAP